MIRELKVHQQQSEDLHFTRYLHHHQTWPHPDHHDHAGQATSMHLARFGTSFSPGSGLGKSNHLKQLSGRWDLGSLLMRQNRELFFPRLSSQYLEAILRFNVLNLCVFYTLLHDQLIWRWAKESDLPLQICRQVLSSFLSIVVASTLSSSSMSHSHQHSFIHTFVSWRVLMTGEQGGERHPCSVLAL